MHSVVVIAVGLALGIGTVALAISRSQGSDDAAPASAVRGHAEKSRERRPTHEENRRVLTAAETRRLVRYASALHACLARRGVEVAGLRKGSRAITMEAANNIGLGSLVGLATSCAAPLGDPPKPASLQAVDARTIVLSVPKQCLLDPKIEAGRDRSDE